MHNSSHGFMMYLKLSPVVAPLHIEHPKCKTMSPFLLCVGL
jgi:hypothetical protein